MPTAPSKPLSPLSNFGPSVLSEGEVWWCDHQPWLLEHGYMLRARYLPDWTPSWVKKNKPYNNCEDSLSLWHDHIVDAIRMSDRAVISLKRLSKTIHPYEAEITSYFSSEPLVHDPHNHCVPLYEILQVPDDSTYLILVMPFLCDFWNPGFKTVGEAIDFFQQILEGLSFMHRHRVAHRDISVLNVMMDPVPIFSRSFHPVDTSRNRRYTRWIFPKTRTSCPTKYYYIDFGLSRKYEPEVTDPLEYPIRGGYKNVPEFQGDGYNKPSNPFPTDIFYLGNLINEQFLQEFIGLEFMNDLVEAMIQDDPAKRPTVDVLVECFEMIRRRFSWWELRPRLAPRHEYKYKNLKRLNQFIHFFRTMKYIILFRPPIPNFRS